MQRPSGGTGNAGSVQVAGPWVSKAVHSAGGSRMCGSRTPGTMSKVAGSHKASPATSVGQKKYNNYTQFNATFYQPGASASSSTVIASQDDVPIAWEA